MMLEQKTSTEMAVETCLYPFERILQQRLALWRWN